MYVKDQHRKGQGVYLYTHWGGHELPALLQSVVKRGDRLNDAHYLARIIFCEMVGTDTEGATGYGISSEICDNEHDILEVDCEAGTVSRRARPCREHADCQQNPPMARECAPIKDQWSFADYAALDVALALKDY